ncbi:response regulator transcription factor [Flavihumibacter petaseus]|uniref:Putative two-component response regulator n=1 Tax=Flavihumibacter petaseus NBRC 106054 TaxID=1220578 RepID=A0A0E9N7C0_9BACT|nr:response regulator transcription factor [Flavihumibacter petaseus]GAO45245.1 putative two-component response regulator [Flavihumibacter petaseus NBRC 106054]
MTTAEKSEKTIRLLIVDDHKMVRDGLKMMIESFRNDLPAQVDEAESGREALLKVGRRPYDLVIMDYRLPDANGAETIQAMLRSHPRLAVIGLSNYDELAQVENMIEAGANGYLLKNIDTRELQMAIRQALQYKTYYSSEIMIKLLQKEEETKAVVRPLSPREKQILHCIVLEWNDEQIAQHLGISKRTIQTHRSNMFHKLKVRNIAGLVKAAIRLGLVPG